MATQETLIQRFWRHVFEKPTRPAFLVKNRGPVEQPILIGGGPMHAPHVYVPKREAYRPLSHMDAGILVAEIVTFLRQCGFKRGDKAAILAWNRPEWVWTDLAIQTMGGVTVPIYPNSNGEAVDYIIANSGATFIFGDSSEQLAKVGPQSDAKKFLLSEPIVNLADYEVTPPSHKEFSILTRNQLLDIEQVVTGKARDSLLASELASITRKDPATIIYTSGSTGRPKGVVLTHGNIASACETLSATAFQFNEDDVALSYLPLAHVYERVDGNALTLWNAIPSAYCSPEEMGDVIPLIKPTMLIGVPAVWRKMKDKIDKKLTAETGLKAKLVAWALKQNKPGFCRWLADKLVFNKVRAGMGGRLRIVMSGGAAISSDILNFFNLVGINLLEGYGMTETSGGVIVNTPSANKVGTVGKVIPNVLIKIVPREQDLDTPNKGVLWMKNRDEHGPIFGGYLGLPEENAKSFDAEGYFCSGDVVQLLDGGYVAIRGRAKRQFKTDQGKYVSPDDVEKAFDGESIIGFMVPIGDGLPFVSALVFVNQLTARDHLKAKGITVPAGQDAAAFYATHGEIVALVEAAKETANKKLQRWETVKKFTILPVEATVANGLLTPTLKIRTEEAMKRYKAEVEAMYKK
jgi:long-chain acyl-CoA synthetase